MLFRSFATSGAATSSSAAAAASGSRISTPSASISARSPAPGSAMPASFAVGSGSAAAPFFPAPLFDAGAIPFEEVEDGVAGFIFAGALASFDAFAEPVDRFSAPLVAFAPDVVDGRFGTDFATTAAFSFALCFALIFVRGVALCLALVFPFDVALGFAAVVAADFVGVFAVPLPGRFTTGAPLPLVLDRKSTRLNSSH